MTYHSATIIDIGSNPKGVAQQGVVDVRLPDHQLIFWTRKISRIKRGTYKHIKFRSFKDYSADLFEETLTSMNFSNNQNLNDAAKVYDDFIQKIMPAVDKVTPIKERRIKHNSQKCLMVKFLKQLKIVISYWKNLKNPDCMSILNYITRLDLKYISCFQQEKKLFWK